MNLFINRSEELEMLNKLSEEKKGNLIIIYGRRRVGKTRLIQEFMKDRNGLYFYVPNAEEKTILAEFSRVVEVEFFEGFRFSDFNSFMEYLTKVCGKKVIAFDEFQRLTNIDGAFSVIQKYWDERLSERCFLILSGSSIGTIKKVALHGDAPLYGRRTALIKIKPLKYHDLFEWFEKYSAEELVSIYGSFGGTPAYLEHVDERSDVEKNIVEKILSKRSPLYDEPEMLLMQEIRTPQRYMDILTAIALGKNSISEISDFTGLNRENVTTYLKTLETLDLIERIVPAGARKRGLYVMRDPFFRFWFRFVRPNKRMLELGLEKNVWRNIREEFNLFLGQIFEDICQEVLIEMVKREQLPIHVGEIGKWWWKETEIDILGLQKKDKKALAIEVKWKDLGYKEVKKLLSALANKMSKVPDVEKPVLGIMGRRIENKEILRKEGYIIMDIQDIEQLFTTS